jgi:hypothetical protein
MGELANYGFNLGKLMKSERARDIVSRIRAGGCRCFWECAMFCTMLFSIKGISRCIRA